MQTISKKCSRCNLLKTLDEFNTHVHTRDGRTNCCKVCEVKRTKINRQKRWARNIKEREKDIMGTKKYNLKKYKLTLEDYNEMFVQQQGCCIICGLHNKDLKRALNVDHNHITGETRGLLCGNCNRGLGMFKEDIDLLLNAIQYLKNN